MKKTPSLIAQLFAAPLKMPSGVRNAVNTYSRRLLNDAEKKNTTPADLARIKAAQEKRDRKNARRAGSEA